MRSKKRIQPFIDFIFPDKINHLITKVWKLPEQDPINIIIINTNINSIKEFWENNPDLRFAQVLITLNLLPNYEGFWYYKEDNEIIEQWNTY